MLSQPFDGTPNRNIHHANEISESSAYHKDKFPTMATSFTQQRGFPHHASPSYEHHGLVGLSSVMVQQKLANLQTSFKYQIVAFVAALGATTNSICHFFCLTDVFGESNNLFPTLTATYYLSGSRENSIGVLGGEKLNGLNYFLWSLSIKMALEGHHKFGYPTSEVPRLGLEDPQDRIWKGEDSLLRFALINSMGPSSGKSILVCEHCKKPWHM